MAELNLPTLRIDIEADGSAAIEELQRTGEAVEEMNDQLERASGDDALGPLADSAREAGDELQRTGDAARETGAQLQQAAKKASVDWKSLGEEMGKVGTAMSAAISAPVTAMLAASVSGASDLAETLGKTEVVFGDLNDDVLEWASNSVESMGMAQQTALDMASAYGDLATGMGLGRDSAAEMSMSLTQLAADLASFKNMAVEDVKGALGGVFTGETEALKGLGVVMNQTNLEQFALTQGITRQVSEMTQAEQVQLRYAYVMAQTANAQGDFVRTGGGLANQTRALGEAVKEAGNAFGEVLIPVITPVVSALREAVTSVSEMDDGTKRMILAIGMAVAAVGPLLLVGGKVIGMVNSIRAALAAASLNPVVIAIAAAVAGLTALAAAMHALKPEIDTTGDAYQQLKSDIVQGATGKLSLDTSGVPEEVSVSITADGQKALTEAENIITELSTDPRYAGKIAIDGDPEKARDALRQVQADIAGVREAVSIEGNDQAAREAVQKLQADISQLDALVTYTDDPTTKALLMRELNRLRAELNNFNANVTFTTTGDEGIETLRARLNTLPKDETFTATGEFKVSAATQEAIDSYAEALAAAAAATGDYATAVDAMNQAADAEAQRKKQEVAQGLADTLKELTGNLNDNIITQDEYDRQIAAATEQANSQIKAIEDEAEAMKDLNEVLANGSKADDNNAISQISQRLYANEHTSSEQGLQALNRLDQGTSADAGLDAERARIGLLAEESEKYQGAASAVLAYQSAVAEANRVESEGDLVSDQAGNVMPAQEALERAQLLEQVVERYRQHRTERRHVRRCLFRQLRLQIS